MHACRQRAAHLHEKVLEAERRDDLSRLLLALQEEALQRVEAEVDGRRGLEDELEGHPVGEVPHREPGHWQHPRSVVKVVH